MPTNHSRPEITKTFNQIEKYLRKNAIEKARTTADIFILNGLSEKYGVGFMESLRAALNKSRFRRLGKNGHNR